MAENVFEILERLKLAEFGKTKAIEAIKKKELDMIALKKKNDRLIKEATEEGKARVKAEMDIKVLQEQVRNMKQLNHDTSQRLKDECRKGVKLMEENEQIKEKVKLLETRLSFLLNKMQLDEDSHVVQRADRKKLEAQVISLMEKSDELTHKLIGMSESNKVITQALRLKHEEWNEINAQYQALVRTVDEDKKRLEKCIHINRENVDDKFGTDKRVGGVEMDLGSGNVINTEGRYFFVQSKTIDGGVSLSLQGRNTTCMEWLNGKHRANTFLKKAQQANNGGEMLIEKIANLYCQLFQEQQEKIRISDELADRERQLENMYKKLNYLQDVLATEEDAKRRILLRYIHAVKEHATAVSDGSGGVLQLPESNMSDEEVYAIAALLRNNTSIVELNLRNNHITDDGARALGAVLADKSGLKLVDLRGNKIGPGVIKVIAEALERAERVKHVYVHQGGKIEALGACTSHVHSTLSDISSSVTLETVCVVDIRDNNPAEVSHPYELEKALGQPTVAFAPGKMTCVRKTLGVSGDLTYATNAHTTNAMTKQPSQSLEQMKPLVMSAEPVMTAAKEQRKQRQVRKLTLFTHCIYLIILLK